MKTYPYMDGDQLIELVEQRKYDDLFKKLCEAEELIREIRDDEVNPQDEADKFLRDQQPSELSKARRELNAALAENTAMRAAIREAHAALDGCREDTCELFADHDWWKDEPRCGYSTRWAEMKSRITKADAALAKLQPFLE